jgi:protein-L-isoaspartate(D-aspartate) O-methyltransferase
LKKEKNISKSHENLIQNKSIILVLGDGRKGCEEYGPYNCIHVGAGKFFRK